MPRRIAIEQPSKDFVGSSALDVLPDEILSHIVQEVSDSGYSNDIYRLSSVSKRLYRLCLPLLYRRISIYSSAYQVKRAAQLYETLRSRPSRCKMVKEVNWYIEPHVEGRRAAFYEVEDKDCLIEEDGEDWPFDVEPYRDAGAAQEAEVFFGLAILILRRLRWITHLDIDMEAAMDVQDGEMFDAIQTWPTEEHFGFEQLLFRHLSSIRIRRKDSTIDCDLNAFKDLLSLPSLRQLTLDGPAEDDLPTSSLPTFLTHLTITEEHSVLTTSWQPILCANRSTLEVLRIVAGMQSLFWRDSGRVTLSDLFECECNICARARTPKQFPMLRALRLAHLVVSAADEDNEDTASDSDSEDSGKFWQSFCSQFPKLRSMSLDGQNLFAKQSLVGFVNGIRDYMPELERITLDNVPAADHQAIGELFQLKRLSRIQLSAYLSAKAYHKVGEQEIQVMKEVWERFDEAFASSISPSRRLELAIYPDQGDRMFGGLLTIRIREAKVERVNAQVEIAQSLKALEQKMSEGNDKCNSS